MVIESSSVSNSQGQLESEVQRIIFVKNLPFSVTSENIFQLFNEFGEIEQVRLGNNQKTKGTCYIVFKDIVYARDAFRKLNGFSYQNRYLVISYFKPTKQQSHWITTGDFGI